jgi:hypothetical protein
MNIDLEQLKQAALAATPGPWEYFVPGDSPAVNSNRAAFLIGPAQRSMDRSQGFSPEDAAHMAFANPAAVLELIERLERAEAVNRDAIRNAALDRCARGFEVFFASCEKLDVKYIIESILAGKSELVTESAAPSTDAKDAETPLMEFAQHMARQKGEPYFASLAKKAMSAAIVAKEPK